MASTGGGSEGSTPYGPPTGPGGPDEPEPQPTPDGRPAWGAPPPPEPVQPAWGPPPLPPQGDAAPPPPPPSPLPAPPTPLAPWAPPPGAFSAGAPGQAGLAYGRTLDRVMAWWLDSLIVAVPALILAAILGGVADPTGLRLGGASLVASIIAVGIHLLYFVAFWTGGAQATPGMRLMKLRIGGATSGAVLTVQQGIARWLAIGGVFQLVQLVPDLSILGALLAFAWAVVLLATTATSPSKQGLHDRMADTAIVQPADARTPAVTCLVLTVGLFLVWVLGLVALVFLGGQVSSILSTVGGSI